MAQTPGINTPIDTTLKCGWYHEQALDQDDATKPLRAAFLDRLNTWEGALDFLAKREKEAMGPRVRVRFAETRLEMAIDDLYNDCKKSGNEAVFNSVFKDGKPAETRPRGDSQRKRTEDVLLIKLRALPETHPIRVEHLSIIEGRLADLTTAIVARREAALNTAQAQADANIAREDLIAAFRSDLGAITSLWPRSRALRDRFFLPYRSADSGDEDEGGGGSTEG